MSIIIFDSECLMCSNAVSFIINHDSKKKFYFLALDSNRAKEITKKFNITQDSIILVDDDTFCLYSEAILKISKALDSPYNYLYLFRVLPLFLRDYVYKFVAKHRKKFFKKKEICLLNHQDRIL